MARGVDEEMPKMTPGRAALLGLMRRSLAATMDPSVSLLENAQKVASPPPWIDAFPRRDYNAGMITDLHEAKNNFGQLVRLAAEGEEIVITVSGRPAARLTSIAPREAIVSGRKQWADELIQVVETARAGAAKSTPQSFWDELREGPA